MTLLANAALATLVMLISHPDWSSVPVSNAALYAEELVSTTIFSVVGALTMRTRMKKANVPNGLRIFVSAFVTANGGGTIRDLLMIKAPFWYLRPEYAAIPLLITIAAFFIRSNRLPLTEPLLRINDNLGTGIFILGGVAKVAATMPFNHPCFMLTALSTGLLTGMGGGVLRDLVLFRKVPTAFKTASGVNGLISAAICAGFMGQPIVDLHGWGWILAGLLLLTMNKLTAGKSFTFK